MKGRFFKLITVDATQTGYDAILITGASRHPMPAGIAFWGVGNTVRFSRADIRG
ncbi:MAG: hypothetical protein V1793_13230 [Pseudomonadota bacterium]